VQLGNYLLILPKNQGRYPTEKWIRIPADFNQGTYADAHHRALHVVSSGWLTAVALERQGAVVKVQVTNAVNNPYLEGYNGRMNIITFLLLVGVTGGTVFRNIAE
jgi:hypothetical protein